MDNPENYINPKINKTMDYIIPFTAKLIKNLPKYVGKFII